MGRDSVFYGRNPLKEAISLQLPVRKVFVKGPSDREFVENLIRSASAYKNLRVESRIPDFLMKEAHQGVAFELNHSFYLEDQHQLEHPRILLCNHLQDVQNLGALSRSAAAFGFNLLVHEKRRSFRVNAAAVKVSMGQCFRLQYMEVANLATICQRLKKLDYEVCGLDSEGDLNLFDWRPSGRVALLLGSEGAGISRPLSRFLDFRLRIPMQASVESLNVSQAGSIAMSWIENSGLLKS